MDSLMKLANKSNQLIIGIQLNLSRNSYIIRVRKRRALAVPNSLSAKLLGTEMNQEKLNIFKILIKQN